MIVARLKEWMPRSLYGRAVLIFLVPVMTILLVATIVFFQRFYEDVTQQMTGSVVQELRLILDEFDSSNDAAAALAIAAPLGIQVGVGAPFEGDRRDFIDLSGLTIIDVLRGSIRGVTGVDLESRNGFARISIARGSDTIVLDVPRNRLSARNPHQFLVLIGFTALLMSGIALIYLRNQMRPIRRLALAAEAFGKGRVVPYRPAGATEVRLAGASFLNMRDRIERQMEQRTMMLSGVSHDLRTPLTRMRLGLSLMEEGEDVRALLRDVKDMDEMLEAFLAFARGDALEEPERTDPIELVRELVQQAARTLPVRLGVVAGHGTAMLRPVALRRALNNLVTNAVRYGNEAQVSVDVSERAITFLVEDSGAGIPVEKRHEVLKPFARLDAARNQDTGSGVGLGLTIAADIARQHGGTLSLGDSKELGGARVEISLPR